MEKNTEEQETINILCDVLGDLLEAIEVLFDHDWDYTKTTIEDPEGLGLYCDGGQTFLNPDYEKSGVLKWINRDYFLSAYKEAAYTYYNLVRGGSARKLKKLQRTMDMLMRQEHDKNKVLEIVERKIKQIVGEVKNEK